MTEHFTQAEAVALAATIDSVPLCNDVPDYHLQALCNAAAKKGRAALLEELGKVEPFGLFCGTTDKGGFFGSLLTKDVPPEKCHLFARPLPAQDVNAELVEALEFAHGALKWFQESYPHDFTPKGLESVRQCADAIAAAKQKEQS